MTHQSKSLALLLFVVAALLAACTLAPADTTRLDAPSCIVTATNLNLRTGPGVDYPRTSKMPSGSRFVVRAQNSQRTWLVGDWNGQTGWAAALYLRCPAEVARVPTLTLWPEPPVSAPPQPQTGRQQPVQYDAAVVSAADQGLPAVNVSGVSLLEPLAPTLSGRLMFRWASSMELQPGYAYELVFWEPGQDPLRDGFSPIGARPESEVNVNLEETAQYLTRLSYGHDYQWGVLLIWLDPYQRVAYLGGAHPFRFLSTGDGAVSDIGSNPAPEPESTNEPVKPSEPTPTSAPAPWEPTPTPDRPDNPPPPPPGAP